MRFLAFLFIFSFFNNSVLFALDDDYNNVRPFSSQYDIDFYDQLVLYGTEHVSGPADGVFYYDVINPDDVTGHQYELSFSRYLWDAQTEGSMRDLTTSFVGCAVYRLTGNPNTVFDCSVEINTQDYNNADGIKLTFPTGTVIDSLYIDGYSVEGMIGEGDMSNTVMFGDSSQSGNGYFSGGQTFSVYVNTQSMTEFPFLVDWVIYDDGWAQLWCIDNCDQCEYYQIGTGCDGTVYTEAVNQVGQHEIVEEGEIYEYEYPNETLVLHLKDVSLDQVLLSTSDLPNQEGTNMDTIDGFKLYKGTVLYEESLDFRDIQYDLNQENADLYGDPIYSISSYFLQGWASSSMAVDTEGIGITNIDTLKRDIQVRFSGEYNEIPDQENINGVPMYYYNCESDDNGDCIGGSYAWLNGARYYDISDHPDPGNFDQDGTPFRLWVPFEVWDMEAPNGPEQIDISIYDRTQNLETEGDTIYPFNPFDRMYTHFIHTQYDADGIYIHPETGDPTGYYTWNVVWWDTQHNKGDMITFEYSSPVTEDDVYRFTPDPSMVEIDPSIINPETYMLSQNYPNPFNPTTNIHYNLLNSEHVSLNIYDLNGRLIKSLVNEKQNAGARSLTWDGSNEKGQMVAAGMYIYMIKAGNFISSKKMLLLK